jgi:hypothetical protein
MFSALDSQTIAAMDEKYLEQIQALGSNEFCKQLTKSNVPLQDMLYLTMRFCEGVLTEMPYHCGPIEDDHIESCETLIALNREGVLTDEGQRSTMDGPHRQRSYLDFHIGFDAEQHTDMVELVETLHRKGLNVWADIVNHNDWNDTQRIMLFKTPQASHTREYDQYELNAPMVPDVSREIRMKHDLYWVTGHFTSCPPGVTADVMVELDIPHQYALYACVFNIEWDMLQADEIVLESILELKQRK